jgi:uncharacterized protein YegP (UPF0339 family)
VFTAPTAGSYEFRFFANNTYTRLATSSTVTVAASAGLLQLLVEGVAAPTQVTAIPGTLVTVTVNGGPANATDWVGLYPVGAANSGYLTWYYLNNDRAAPPSGYSGAEVTFTMPLTAGDYEFRLFANDTQTLLTTSTKVVSQAVITAPTSAMTGSRLGIIVQGGPANVMDWVALYPVGAADSGYIAWYFLNNSTTPPSTGSSSAPLVFTAPAAGSYEFRFFANNTYTRLATSDVIAVRSGP